MSSTYAGNSASYPTDITIPDDGDAVDAASILVAIEGLADRTEWLKARGALGSQLVTATDVSGAIVAPAGCHYALLIGCGGGGGGGGGGRPSIGDGTYAYFSAGGGGGAGAWERTVIVPVTAGTGYDVTIGAGGAVGIGGTGVAATNGTSGGDTTFATHGGAVLAGGTFRGGQGGRSTEGLLFSVAYTDLPLTKGIWTFGGKGKGTGWVRSYGGADAVNSIGYPPPAGMYEGGPGVSNKLGTPASDTSGGCSPNGYTGGLWGGFGVDVSGIPYGHDIGGGCGGGGGAGPYGNGATGGTGATYGVLAATVGATASANTGAGAGGGGGGAGGTSGADGGVGGSGRLLIVWMV